MKNVLYIQAISNKCSTKVLKERKVQHFSLPDTACVFKDVHRGIKKKTSVEVPWRIG